ncbi:MAG TPA: hypothetical protein VKB39_06480, partial [Candidatus Baltobacteraceae bacterium]|nr:hypothetical protein [Candidatus Baltobacteraceae bacterium]
MNQNGRYRELEARVRDERARLEGVRADYEVIMRSRFHALRMLWFSLKQLFGITGSDVYAAWSTGLEPTLTAGRRPARAKNRKDAVVPAGGLSEEESAMIAAWN